MKVQRFNCEMLYRHKNRCMDVKLYKSSVFLAFSYRHHPVIRGTQVQCSAATVGRWQVTVWKCGTLIPRHTVTWHKVRSAWCTQPECWDVLCWWRRNFVMECCSYAGFCVGHCSYKNDLAPSGRRLQALLPTFCFCPYVYRLFRIFFSDVYSEKAPSEKS